MAYLTHSPVAHRVPSPVSLALGMARLIATWAEVARERRALAEMGMSRLEDLGLTEADVKRETRKPFFWTRRG